MKEAILVVSFGTTFEDTREKNITAVLNRVAAAHPDCPVYEAWTSSMIMRALEKRGQHVDNVPEALTKMHADGITDIKVLPTHLLYGDEYDKMRAFLDADAEKFSSITVAAPLLAGDDDLRAVLSAVAEGVETAEDEALVLMGHGTPHFCNTVYAAMDYHAKATGLKHVFVGTVEAFPDLEALMDAVRAADYRRVVLTPLMLVAGDHANNDMASDEPDSWKTQFTEAGLPARAVIRGLGEYEKVLDLYQSHLDAIM